MQKKAKYWKKLEDNRVECTLCPHFCSIAPDKSGICRIRSNIDGKLYSIGYGKTTSISMDPIEKKPLYHFKPGSFVLSIAPNGCNLRCRWCQNWEISQNTVPTRQIDPELLVSTALRERASGIAFTYTEPLIWFEYIIDVAKIARPKGLAIIAVTNGYINPEPLDEILPYIDAMNIDLKAMNDKIYKENTGGSLEPVLDTIRHADAKSSVEVTILVIPTINDTERDIHAAVDFIAGVNPKIPLHLSRYSPAYQFTESRTSPETLERAYEIAKEKLSYVYIGNLLFSGADDTFCPQCGNLLVERKGFTASIVGISDDGKCRNCETKVDFAL